jgi:hypothetical protein
MYVCLYVWHVKQKYLVYQYLSSAQNITKICVQLKMMFKNM